MADENIRLSAKELEKLEGRRRRADRLLRRVLSGQRENLPDMIGHILNHYPKTRDDDILLAIQLYETFFPDLVDDRQRIALDSLFKLPRSYDIQRIRAKIQNEYGLYLASPEIRATRLKKGEADREFHAFDKMPGSAQIYVVADESGRTDDFLVIGSLWIYNTSAFHNLNSELNRWADDHNARTEFHFRDIRNHTKEIAFRFFENAYKICPYSRYIALVTPRKGVKDQQALLYQAYAELLIAGLQIELKDRSFKLPAVLKLFKDAETGTDAIQLPGLERSVKKALKDKFGEEQAFLDKVTPVASEGSYLIQVSDLFASTISRWLNTGTPGIKGNAKENVALRIGALLGILKRGNQLEPMSSRCRIINLSREELSQ